MTNCIGLWFALSFLLWTLSSTFVCALEFGLHICVCFGPCCSNNFLHICSSCLFQPKNRHENGAYVFFGHVQSCTHPHLYIYICICICTYRLLARTTLPRKISQAYPNFGGSTDQFFTGSQGRESSDFGAWPWERWLAWRVRATACNMSTRSEEVEMEMIAGYCRMDSEISWNWRICYYIVYTCLVTHTHI